MTRTKSLLDIAIDGELTTRQQTDHEQPRTKSRKATLQTQFAANLEQTRHRALAWRALGLVDLAQHRVGRLRDDGGGAAGNHAGAKVDCRRGAAGDG